MLQQAARCRCKHYTSRSKRGAVASISVISSASSLSLSSSSIINNGDKIEGGESGRGDVVRVDFTYSQGNSLSRSTTRRAQSCQRHT